MVVQRTAGARGRRCGHAHDELLGEPALTWTRPVSGIERAWLAAAALHPPFVNQAVLEGRGEPDAAAWREAVAVASAGNPGSRVVLRGMLCRQRWDALGECRFRVVDAPAWDGCGPAGAPFLRDPLDATTGPTSEVVIVRGHRPRVVVRTAHATMDGGGTLAFLADLFRARNGEPIVGHPDTRTDLDLAEPRGREGAPPADALPPMGPSSGPAEGVVWTRLRVESPRRPLLGRFMVGLAAYARKHGEGTVRFDVPVDLRRANPEVLSTANLTGMAAIEVGPDASPEAVSTAVRDAVASGRHHARIRGAGLLRHLPLSWVVQGAERGATAHLDRQRFSTTAIVSNLGRVDLSPFQASDFETEGLFFVPPGTEVTPLFAALCGTESGVEVMLSSPVRFCSEGRLERLTDAIRDALTR